jgi:NAD+ synthase
MAFRSDVLDIANAPQVLNEISSWLQRQVLTTLRRKGAVIALSGGIDSAVCAALCARALGRDRVLALLLPERDSSTESVRLGAQVADHLGIPYLIEDITPILEAAACYRRQEEAVRSVFPAFAPGWKFKIVLPSLLQGDRLNVSRLVVQNSRGEEFSDRMAPDAYRQLVAATNFKQRSRTMMGYYHADRLHYAFCGTANRLEYDQGFFVKGGDGSGDIKPIAHLYKTEVYQLGRCLGLPEDVLNRRPTTDTFSLPQSQEEFYFSLPYEKMDLCLYAHNHGISAEEAGPVLGLTTEQIARVYSDIEAKRRYTLPLHFEPLLVEKIPEISQAMLAAREASTT